MNDYRYECTSPDNADCTPQAKTKGPGFVPEPLITHHSHLEEVFTSLRNLGWDRLEASCIKSQSFSRPLSQQKRRHEKAPTEEL